MKFIRKNGRIIPIREKEERKRGAVAVAAATGVAGIGGYLSGFKTRKAENISQQSFDFLNEKSDSLPSGTRTVSDGFLKARTKLKFAHKVALGARLGAASLAFYGLNKIMRNEEDSAGKELAKAGAAAVASEGVTRGIYIGFNKRHPFKMKLQAGTQAAAKSASLDIIKNLIKRKVT